MRSRAMNSSSNRKKLFEGAEMQQRYKEQRMEIMEEQNNQLTDTLDERIGALKGLTIELGDEAREHNRLLDEMVLILYSQILIPSGTRFLFC